MNSNPFEIIDPFIEKKKMNKEKLNQIKKDIFIESFIDIIKDKNKEELLKINQILINKLQEKN